MESHPIQTILVVDDEPAFCKMMQARLHRVFPYVETVGSAAEAIERLKRNGVSLVIIDIRMPGMDGHTLGNRIRRERPALPVMFVSGDLETAKEAAAHIVWYKPDLDWAEFVQAIQKRIGIYLMHQGIGEIRSQISTVVAGMTSLEKRTILNTEALVADGWILDQVAQTVTRRNYWRKLYDLVRSPAAHMMATVGGSILALVWALIGDQVKEHAQAVKLAPTVQREISTIKAEQRATGERVEWIVRRMAGERWRTPPPPEATPAPTPGR